MTEQEASKAPGDADNDPTRLMATVGRDVEDSRDLVFTASDAVVASLPSCVDHGEYARYVRETWHQRGLECTGFALAAIANFIHRKQLGNPNLPSVSRRMLYEMAQVNDGEDYQTGSTPRGALKGWKKVGVARDDLWPYDPDDEDGTVHGGLTLGRLLDARTRPLVRYRSIADGATNTVRAALAQGHAIFASSDTHGGWYRLFLSSIEPKIRRAPHDKPAGDHAFVIVGYDDDEQAFWVHNSWGPEWGREGYALLPYREWEESWSSAWVVDAVTESLEDADATDLGPAIPSDAAAQQMYRDMWPHLVVLRDDGRLSSSGRYEMDAGSVRTLLFMFQEHAIETGWEHRRLAVFADGGHWATGATIERLQPMRDRLMAAGIYPIFVVWETAWFADLQQELRVRERGRPEDDDRQAPQGATVSHAWDLVRERARLACQPDGGGVRELAEAIAFKRSQKPFDVHLISHGAGDYLLAEFASRLSTPVATATLVGSASPLSVLDEVYGPMLDTGRLQHLSVINLDEDTERVDSFGPLSESLLTLVSSLLADGLDRPDTTNDVTTAAKTDQPLLGLQRDVAEDDQVERFVHAGLMNVDTVSRSTHDDMAFVSSVIEATVQRMLQHETLNSTPRRDADPALPRDPLERAEALRRRGDRDR